MSFSTVTNSTVVVTSEATADFAETSKPITLEQALSLFEFIRIVRPDWSDRKSVMRELQRCSLAGAEGHEVISYVVESAVTEPDREWADLDILGAVSA